MPRFSDHIVSSPQRLAREICAEIMATEDEIAEAIEAAVKHEREACASIADRCADDETRKALGANATINARQIAAAIRARGS